MGFPSKLLLLSPFLVRLAFGCDGNDDLIVISHTQPPTFSSCTHALRALEVEELDAPHVIDNLLEHEKDWVAHLSQDHVLLLRRYNKAYDLEFFIDLLRTCVAHDLSPADIERQHHLGCDPSQRGLLFSLTKEQNQDVFNACFAIIALVGDYCRGYFEDKVIREITRELLQIAKALPPQRLGLVHQALRQTSLTPTALHVLLLKAPLIPESAFPFLPSLLKNDYTGPPLVENDEEIDQLRTTLDFVSDCTPELLTRIANLTKSSFDTYVLLSFCRQSDPAYLDFFPAFLENPSRRLDTLCQEIIARKPTHHGMETMARLPSVAKARCLAPGIETPEIHEHALVLDLLNDCTPKETEILSKSLLSSPLTRQALILIHGMALSPAQRICAVDSTAWLLLNSTQTAIFDALTTDINIQDCPSISPRTPLSEIQSVLNENYAPHMRMWMLIYQKELSGAHRVSIKALLENKRDAPMRGLLSTIIDKRLSPELLTHIATLNFACEALLPLFREVENTDMPYLQDLCTLLSTHFRPKTYKTSALRYDSYTRTIKAFLEERRHSLLWCTLL